MAEDIKIIDRVVHALNITKSELARKLNISKSAINFWRIHGIPSEHCSTLELWLKDTKDPLTRIDMRPDDWHKWWPELEQQDSKESI